VAKAKIALEIARAEFETTEQEFIVQVAQTYFDVLSAQDVLLATRSSKVSLTGQLASTKRNFEAGTAIVTDVRDTQARYDLAVAQEMSADNELHVRQLLLSRLVGRRNVTINSLAMPMALPPIVPVGVDAWIDSAEQHPSVRRALLTLQIAQLDRARAEGARLPTVKRSVQSNGM
jgi:outer membrane protein